MFNLFFLVTQFPSLITHHSKILCLFGTITYFPSLNIFHTICGSHTCHQCSFFFSSVPKLTEPNEKKEKKKEKEETQNRSNQWKKKKKKKPNSQPKEERKKRSQRTKGAAEYYLWVPYVCLITILSLSYGNWK